MEFLAVVTGICLIGGLVAVCVNSFFESKFFQVITEELL